MSAPPSPAMAASSGHGEDTADDHDVDSASDSILFVGDLSRTISEWALAAAFAPFGQLISVELRRDKSSGRVLGYAFVKYQCRQEAERAKAALNGAVLCGRAIRLGWAQKNTTLFVGDIDGAVTSQQLRSVFASFGALVEAETFVKSCGKYAFVRFRERADAERAKSEMNGRYIGARQVRIGWSDHHILKHSVHVSFNLTNTDDTSAMTETALRNTFEHFGALQIVTLPRAPHTHALKGFAIVEYADTQRGEQSAHTAISTVTRVDTVNVQCAYAKRQTQRRRSTGAQHNNVRTYTAPAVQSVAMPASSFADAYVSYASAYDAQQYLRQLQAQMIAPTPDLMHFTSALAYPQFTPFAPADAAAFNLAIQLYATRI